MTKTEYYYRDKDVVANKEYMYRLKQQDFDGGIEYTRMVTAKIKHTSEVGNFYPNPASSQVMLDLNFEEETEVQLEIFDALGRSISNFDRHQTPSGSLTLSVSSLVTGKYTVRVRTGNRVFVRDFVKSD